LSEKFNAVPYHEFIQSDRRWRELHAFIKSQEFIQTVISIADIKTGPAFTAAQFTSRFEFSSLPANGGFIRPHRDIPSKIITLVIPIMKKGDWDSSWGGGTDILTAVDPDKPLVDYQSPSSEFHRVRTIPYEPNQCLMFCKTASSWHSVSPIRGPAGIWRRTLTVNIERNAA
jgi:hypothetical protein